jgi:hypothetical protein
MTARGIKVNYNTGSIPGTNAGAHYDSFSLNTSTTDITITGWMRIIGNNGTNRGQVPFNLYSGTDVIETTFIDETFDGASPWSITSYDINGTTDRVGSWAPATNEDWFYCMVWDHVTAGWTYYVAKDGDANMGTAGTGATGRTSHVYDTIQIGYQQFSDYGNNTEHTNVKIWSRKFSSAELFSEMNSEAPVYGSGASDATLEAWWKLASAADLNDYSTHSRTLSTLGTVNDGSMDPVDIRTATGSGCLWYGILKA